MQKNYLQWLWNSFISLSLFWFLSLSTVWAGQLHLYLDADFTHANTASIAIEQGILTALSEVDNHATGQEIVLIRKKLKGNNRRNRDALQDFLADDKGLAVFCGLHSTVVLANPKFIHDNNILLLSPWAAATPITRFGNTKNWVFRLAVDDSKAGQMLVRHATKVRKFSNQALLLETTGWGKTNLNTMTAALKERGIAATGVFWFKWGLQEQGACVILHSILTSGADSILLVANSPEGITITKALLSFPPEERLPIISHWGITGGEYINEITPKGLQQVDLNFLQTKFSFLLPRQTELSNNVFSQATKLFPDTIQRPEDIKAPDGFIHGYDLTKILIAAIEQAGITGEIATDRENIRTALENLKTPVTGLIKNYEQPFRPYSPDDPDAHEALGKEDLKMGQYTSNGEIVLLGAYSE